MTPDRRTFMTGLGAGVGISVLGGFMDGSVEAEENGKTGNVFRSVALQADIVVAGGGLAGVCASLAAARYGAKVILLQDRSRLGGNSSSEIRMHVRGANGSPKLQLWRETGIIEELCLTNAATNPQHSFEMWDLLLYDKVTRESNITLLLDTAVIDADVRDAFIKQVTAISPLLEERYTITARFFVDCTGDAKLAYLAGAEYRQGREGRDVYGESLASPEGDNRTMGNSLLFCSRKYERPMPFTPPPWARKFSKEDFAHRPIYSWEYGYWWIEWGGELDTIHDNRVIRHELLRILLGVWDYIKNSGQYPDAENWALEWVGMIPGKRESRRIIGPYVLTQSDIEQAECFADRVAYGGWPMDDHPPGGIDRKEENPCVQIACERPYSIPLRALYSINRPNLFMAGRDISASHVAFSSSRVMATCSVEGQAVGAAAAFCVRHDILPEKVVSDHRLMWRLQQLLLREDQALVAIYNEDPDDVAREASVTASDETKEGPAEAVIDGYNRDIGDGHTHQWRAPVDGASPWIELRWDKPRSLGTVYLILDTGLHRKLFLTGEESARRGQVWGPQPETVAHYRIEAWTGTQWIHLAENKNNFLRLVRHHFPPVMTDRLRVRVLRTWGDPLARIFEIRCYAPGVIT